MTLIPVGKAGRNKTVEDIVKARERTGAKYLDLSNMNLLKEVETKKKSNK